MEGVIRPDKRSWTTELTDLSEMALKLRGMESRYGFRSNVHRGPKAKTTSRTKEEEDAIQELVKFVLEKPSQASTSSGPPNPELFDPDNPEAIDLFNASIDLASKFKQDLDDFDIDYKPERDGKFVDLDREHQVLTGYNSDTDDLDDVFSSSDSEGDSDGNGEGEIEIGEQKSLTNESITLRVTQDKLDDQDEKDFATFHEYNEAKSRERAQIYMKREKEVFQEHFSDFADEQKYFMYAKKTCPTLGADEHEVMVDDTIFTKVEMPLLAGTIPHSAIRRLTTLALYTHLADDPGNFQWKSTHVMEQLSSTQHNDKQLMRACQRDLTERQNNEYPRDSYIVTVSFFQPSEVATYDLKNAGEPKPGLIIEILNNQTLLDLKKKFICQKNYRCVKECEFEKWTTAHEALVKYNDLIGMNICHGDMLYLNDTIYTDGTPEGEEYFMVIDEWIRKLNSNEIKQYKLGLMAETKISDLKIRFGYPYCYQHQGNCEHLVVFNAIRLPNAVEYSFKTFPRLDIVGKFQAKSCRVDKEQLARWIVVGSDRFPEDPVLLCNNCVDQYCYEPGTGNGEMRKKKGEFKLYPFIQMTAFL